MLVSILRQRSYLIASIHEALDDGEFLRFQEELVDQIGRVRASGIIIDVAALDVIDSFGARALQNLARMARLRGAETVIVGIQPMVALTMVRAPSISSSAGWAIRTSVPVHSLFSSCMNLATAIRKTTWASWPQACITGTRLPLAPWPVARLA